MLHETLMYALKLKRPMDGKGEEKLARYVERQFLGLTERDGAGNVHLDLRGSDQCRTLFVAHMDTVHRKDGKNRVVQIGDKLHAAPGFGALGADDGAGVAMLCHLASCGVPGYYVFTRGEERGGIGAKYLAQHYGELLRQFDRAIAFDRRGIDSIISHQGFSRCCSDDFAEGLADALNVHDMWYSPDNTGVYTDTAEFVDFIPECTNISVGYEHEHSDRECLDLAHFAQLAVAAASIDWEALPVKRDPAEVDDDYSFGSLWAYGGTFTTPEVSRPLATYPKVVSSPAGKRASLEYRLMDALVEAEAGYLNELKSVMAEVLYPEDVSLAKYSLRDLRVQRWLIEESIEELRCGADPENLVMHIYECCPIF